MSKTILFIAVLLLGPSAFAKDCYSGNNSCPSGQGCCSSRAEWIHTQTRDSGTCRELRHCDNNWIWNGGINPKSGFKLPGSMPAMLPDEMRRAAQDEFNAVASWYDRSGNGGLQRNKDPLRNLAVYPHEFGRMITYRERVAARTAWFNCLIGVDNVARYLNAMNVGRAQCGNNDNCVEYYEQLANYHRNTAFACLAKNFYEPYSSNGRYISTKYLWEGVDYSRCPAIYPNCDPAPPNPPR